MVSFDVVLADGTTNYVDANNHPDLFWAMLGGGAGSFGIVTHYTVNVILNNFNSYHIIIIII